MAIDTDFWEAREDLTVIRDFARSRIISPWSVLGVAMARAVTAVPYQVVIPPIVGGSVSAGLYVAVVAPPGTGKGSSDSAGAELLPAGIHVAPLGSGEGLTHQFCWRDKSSGEMIWTHRSVLFTASEAELMKALVNRSASTLSGTLRAGWVGEPLGFSYASRDKSLQIPRLSYRMSAVLSFTPSMGSVLLEQGREGTPQRFLFLPATDPEAPDEVPDDPGTLTLNLPRAHDDGLLIPGSVEEEIRARQRVRVRGESEESELDSHSGLLRLKTAFGLSLLRPPKRGAGYRVTISDWELSGMVMDKSRETRDQLLEDAEYFQQADNETAGKRQAARAVITDLAREESKVATTADSILRVLSRVKGEGWLGGKRIRDKINHRQRQYFDDAAELLLTQGKIQRQETAITPNNVIPGYRYRKVQK